MNPPDDSRVVDPSGTLPQVTNSLSQLGVSRAPGPDGRSSPDTVPDAPVDDEKPLWTQAYILLSQKQGGLIDKFESICRNQQNPAAIFSADAATTSEPFSKMGPDEQHVQMMKIVADGQARHH